MARYQSTLGDDVVQHRFGGEGGVARLLAQVLNQGLQAQAAEALQAAPYERTPDRQGHRNGSYPRDLTTRVGPIPRRVPRGRDGSFSPELVARYQRRAQALVLALLAMVVHGVATRKVTRITEELCGAALSTSTVSALCQPLDPVVTAWRTRSLADTGYPFLLVDALLLRIREGGHVRQRAGLVNALQREFQGTSWQRCQTHFTRNVLDAGPKAVHDPCHAALRAVFDAPDRQRADLLLRPLLEAFATTAPRAVALLEAGIEDALAIVAYPPEVRLRLRTTHDGERLNREIRRRDRVIRIFPNRASAERLLGAVLMEQHEAWSTGRRYVTLDTY